MNHLLPAGVATCRSIRQNFLLTVLAVSVFLVASLGQAAPDTAVRTTFARSAGPLPATLAATARPLSAAHLTETMDLGIRLALRNQAELEKRVDAGEVLSTAELCERYLPLQADYDVVIVWLRGEGFAVTHTDDTHMGVFFTGTAAQVQKSFQVNLTRVTFEGTDYSTADTAPSLPSGIAAPVLGVVGLQPYLRLKPHNTGLRPLGAVGTSAAAKSPDALSPATSYPYTTFTPPQLLTAFNGAGLTYTGTGQRIAIIADTTPGTYNSTTKVSTPNADLQTFWSDYIPNHTGGYEQVVPSGITGTTSPAGTEVTLDAEWSSGMAPGATVRVYAASSSGNGSVSFTNFETCFQQVINDINAGTAIQQLSISYGGNENSSYSSFYKNDDNNYFLVLASQGVSCFASVGDTGSSTVSGSTTSYAAEYFSTSPHITAVGGTTLAVNGNGTRLDETVWNNNSSSGIGGATGGGTSVVFSRPVWQTGTGVPSGSFRVIPDVALPADPLTPAVIVITPSGSQQETTTVGGTSWSSPTWAGFCARINQARASQTPARGTLGVLPARLYPLLAANTGSNFFDITTGNNNYYGTSTTYSATVGYDECTGIGTPNMANLLGTLSGPAITGFAPSTGAAGTSVVITGQNFNLVSSVTFNGTGAAFTINSTTQITATVPPGATTGAIVVSNPALATGAAGDAFTSTSNFTVGSSGTPDLAITKTHAGSFTQADAADVYTITVSNAGTAATSGTVTVSDTLPAGLTATALSGTGWTVAADHLSATRPDALAVNGSYPALTLTVSVSSTAAASVTNMAAVSGGGETNTANDTASDPTTITALTPSQSWRYQYFGTTANTGNAADTANPSGDGIINLVKYALGLNPLVPTISTVTEDTTTGYLRLTVPKNVNATDVSYVVQVTSDLADPSSWITNGTTTDQNTSTTLVVHDNTLFGSVPSRFIRLQVTR